MSFQSSFHKVSRPLAPRLATEVNVSAAGRLNQALGRDGITPFSKILASNRPFKAPLAGVTWHVIVTLIIMLAPPAGDVSWTTFKT